MSKLYDYGTLIERFLNREISVQEFERTYIDEYLAEKGPMSDEVFNSLDWLFFKVDEFTDLPMEPEDDPDEYITEDQLRTCAAETLEEIREFQKLGRMTK